jgi:hypothetical protein
MDPHVRAPMDGFQDSYQMDVKARLQFLLSTDPESTSQMDNRVAENVLGTLGAVRSFLL